MAADSKIYHDLVPEEVPPVHTKNRVICTKIPVPESVEIIQTLREIEPLSLSGQLPVLWDKAVDFNVYDRYGNKWIDFTSGILVANVGHNHKTVIESIRTQLMKNTHNYLFPTEMKYNYLTRLRSIVRQWNFDKIFLLTTGSETIENSIKLARNYKIRKYGLGPEDPVYVLSFTNAFHGRTLGAQLAGGIESQKTWIMPRDHSFIQVPYPDGVFHDTSFEIFLNITDGLDSKRIGCVIIEGYQGGNMVTPSKEYVIKLEKWCKDNDVLLVFDEVQSGFGRTGKFFSFQHYDVTPDIVCCGKGISSSLPLSCILTRKEIADTFDIGEMSNTHSGNPVCVSAALAVLELLEDGSIIQNAEKNGIVLHVALRELQNKYSQVKRITGIGLVAGLHIANHGEPDGRLAYRIVERCFKKGLLMCIPVGYKKSVIKICPPLTITEEALLEGVSVIDQAIYECMMASV